jgi:hypothetical protein
MLLAVAMLLSVGGMAQADTTSSARAEKPTPEQRAEKLTKVMGKQLLLSPEQAQQVHAINLKYAEARKAAARRNREEAKATTEARNAEMEKVLNPAQYQKYLQLERKAARKMRERMHERKAQHAQQPIDTTAQ